jgi:hypothetical protein
LVISLFPFKNVSAQQKINWVDISLLDTMEYAQFEVNHSHNHRYPPSNLFDADFNTCWVSGPDKNNSSIFIKLPELNRIMISIFAGYGKSKKLYYQNGRPEKLRFSVYFAVNPDGYVSENRVLYKAIGFPPKKTIQLDDSFGIQSFPLKYSAQELSEFRKKVLHNYNSINRLPIADTCFVLQIEILETKSGTKYEDVCISEIFFNDSFVSRKKTASNKINKVYLSKDKNVLLLDDDNHGVAVYNAASSVLQLIEVSKDKQWAILISMPAEIQGRVETTYLLVDLTNKEIVNSLIEESVGNYVSGEIIWFETGKNDKTYLIYDDHKIELR